MRKLLIAMLISGTLGATGLGQFTLGVGTQITLPALAGVSLRFWATPSVGLEGVAFVLSGGEGQVNGLLSGRGLARVASGEGASFYLAGGASALLPNADILWHLCGGIEVFLPFAPALALNTEFGFAFNPDGWSMAFGLGIHYYFGKP